MMSGTSSALNSTDYATEGDTASSVQLEKKRVGLSNKCPTRYTNSNLFHYLSEKSSDEETIDIESAMNEIHSVDGSPVHVNRDPESNVYRFILEMVACVIVIVVLVSFFF